MPDAYLVSAARTPIGGFGGALAALPAPTLGSHALRAAIERAGVAPDHVEHVFMGNVLSAGLGQAPARQAGLGAGVPVGHGALTLNKVCGSGLMAVMLAAQHIRCGDADVIAAGGMESMSRAPFLAPHVRFGARMGPTALVDAMLHDGLWDPYNDFHMGAAGERCARDRRITREAQDAFAITSYQRAQAAIAAGHFVTEIAPVPVTDRGKTQTIAVDEEPARIDLARVASLKPAFERDGTITAANASTIADGAAAVVVASDAALRTHRLTPRARIVAATAAGRAPAEFPVAPIDATNKVLALAGLRPSDIDLFEINEAFAVVVLATMHGLDIPHDRVNVDGGAIALGHPIGASGARVLVTLLHALERRAGRRGVATLCLGGGEAVAMVIERA